MKIEELTPKFKLGQELFVISGDRIQKLNVLGIKIHPISMDFKMINPFKYFFKNSENEFWCEEELIYENYEDALNSIKDVEDNTLTLEGLVKENLLEIKKRLGCNLTKDDFNDNVQ